MSAVMTGSVAAAAAGVGSLGVSATFAAGETVIVVAFGQQWFTGTVKAVSDGTNTYSAITTDLNNGNATTGAIQIFKADNVAAGTFTVTLTDNHSSICGIAVYRYTGLAAGAVLATNTYNASPGGSSGANVIAFAGLTPPSQPALLFSAIISTTTVQPTAGTTLAWVDRSAVLSPITTLGCAAEDFGVTDLTSKVITYGTTTGLFNTRLGHGVLIALAGAAVAQNRIVMLN